jgi:hypothetical protein
MAVVDYVVGTARLGWPGAGDSWWERSGISQRRLVYDGPKRAEMAGG